MRRCTFCAKAFALELVMEMTDRACSCGECLMKPAPLFPLEGTGGWTLTREGDVIVARAASQRGTRGNWINGDVTRIPVTIAEHLLNLATGGVRRVDVEKAVADLDALLERMTDDGRAD